MARYVSMYRADKEQEERLKEKRLREQREKKSTLDRSYGKNTPRKHSYAVYAQDKKGTDLAATNAHGRDGVRSAKKAIHANFPHKWLKFSLYNQTRRKKV